MKSRLIILTVIFTILLTGCGIESRKAIITEASTSTLQQKDNKNSPKEEITNTTNTTDENLPVSNNSAAFKSASAKANTQSVEKVSFNVKLFDYLSREQNRNSVADSASVLHGGNLHNSCVYYAGEALRRIGVKIPDSMCQIPSFIDELKKQGFKNSYNLKDLKPGDICFTTDESGAVGGRPTHTYIFMGWASPGVAWIADNQLYDYGSVYHTRLIDFYYLNNQKDKPKEATAFFMYK